MRNIFDQYRQLENRVSHALGHTIASDQRLAKGFAQFLTHIPLGGAEIHVTVQRLPGRPSTEATPEEDNASKSLPDIWLFDNDNKFCCAIENKIGDDLSPDQLNRHFRRAGDLGFSDPYIVAVTPRPRDEPIASQIGNDRITRKN